MEKHIAAYKPIWDYTEEQITECLKNGLTEYDRGKIYIIADIRGLIRNLEAEIEKKSVDRLIKELLLKEQNSATK